MLGVVNSVSSGSGRPDYTAPDRLLGLPTGKLSGVDQRPASGRGLRQLVSGLMRARIATLQSRIVAADNTLELSIQTRNAPQVYDRTGAHLDIRLRPAKDPRLPSRPGLSDLKQVIDLLPDAVVRAGAKKVVIRGGGHLSVALALGAALPSTRVGQTCVMDQNDQQWKSGSEAVLSDPPSVEVVSTGTNRGASGQAAVAAYVDLLPIRSDAAFERFVEEHSGHLSAWIHLRSVSGSLLEPSQAGHFASHLAAHLRQLSATHQNAEVHLMLRCPFPIAVLLGRLTNTLQLVTYEWDSAPSTPDDQRPRYVPCMRVAASSGGGVISELLMPHNRR